MGVIRTLLALSVVLFHSYGIFSAKEVMTGGTVSVQAFYMISGFYMALILNEKYRSGKGSYRLFLTNRFLRIYPIYWTCLIIACLMCVFGTLFFHQPFYFWYWTSNWAHLSWSTVVILVFCNLFLLGSDVLMFTGVNRLSGDLEFNRFPQRYNPMTGEYFIIPQIWTVGVELAFYLVAPFLVRLRWNFQVAIVISALYMRWHISHENFLYNDPWSYRFFPSEIALFLAGSLAYQLYTWLRTIQPMKGLSYGLWFLVLFAIMYYPHLDFMDQEAKRWYFYSFFFLCMPFLFLLFKNNKWDRLIGELSFPIYVCHHFVMFLWRKYFWVHTDQMKWFGITTAVSSIVFAVVLYYGVILPIEKFRQKRSQIQVN